MQTLEADYQRQTTKMAVASEKGKLVDCQRQKFGVDCQRQEMEAEVDGLKLKVEVQQCQMSMP